MSVHSKSNWNLEVLVFREREKSEYPEKMSQSKGENQQQTHIYMATTWGWNLGDTGRK